MRIGFRTKLTVAVAILLDVVEDSCRLRLRRISRRRA